MDIKSASEIKLELSENNEEERTDCHHLEHFSTSEEIRVLKIVSYIILFFSERDIENYYPLFKSI